MCVFAKISLDRSIAFNNLFMYYKQTAFSVFVTILIILQSSVFNTLPDVRDCGGGGGGGSGGGNGMCCVLN